VSHFRPCALRSGAQCVYVPRMSAFVTLSTLQSRTRALRVRYHISVSSQQSNDNDDNLFPRLFRRPLALSQSYRICWQCQFLSKMSQNQLITISHSRNPKRLQARTRRPVDNALTHQPRHRSSVAHSIAQSYHPLSIGVGNIAFASQRSHLLE